MSSLIFHHLKEKGREFASKLRRSKPFYLFFIGSTMTSTIPGISIAGATPELTLYTPACDIEYLALGSPKSLSVIPVTPEGIPTPALITRACIKNTDAPFLIVDCGSYIEPKVPHVRLPSKCVGGNIETGKALSYDTVKALINEAASLASMISKTSNMFVIGESIPGGTTTALGILTALGYNAFGKVSSTSPENPHELKKEVVERGMASAEKDPLKAISSLGDPVHISIAGFISKAIENSRILLAGGTQMVAVLAIAKLLSANLPDRVAIGTTRWLISDPTSNITDLISQVAPEVPIIAANISFKGAPFEGLRFYERNYVKEGVGAGGALIATNVIYSRSIEEIRYFIYKEYELLVMESGKHRDK